MPSSQSCSALLAAVAILAAACESSAPGAAPASGSAAAAESPAVGSGAAPAGKKTCAAVGAKEGEGIFGKPCVVPWDTAAPLTVKDVGYKESFGRKVRMCAFTNTSDEDVTWAFVASWYYTEDGTLLEVAPSGGDSKYKMYTHNGSTLAVAKGETRELECGWDQQDDPKEATFQVEVLAWAWGTPSLHVGRDASSKNLDDRPLGGFK